jgi:hypothetical protein
MFQTLAWDALYVTTMETLLFETARLLLPLVAEEADGYEIMKLFINAFDRACFMRCNLVEGPRLVAYFTRLAQECFESADALYAEARELERNMRARRDAWQARRDAWQARRDAWDAEYSEADTDSDGE